MEEFKKVKVFRFNPAKDTQSRYETYEVRYVEGMRVLDLLHSIHDDHDGSLAYRWECRSGQCGSCAVIINNKAGLACQTLVPRNLAEVAISPLPVFPIVKDLVVDLEKGYRHLLKVNPFMHRIASPKRPEIIHSYEVEDLKPMRECIECWSCVSMCPVVKVAWDVYGGPVVMSQLARLAFDKRNVFDHLLTAFLDGLNACTQCATCKEVCPKEIDIPEKAVGKMRYLAYNKRNLLRDGHKAIIEEMNRNHNPLFELNETRANWAKNFKVPLSKKGAKILYFVGCMASWREQVVAQSTATLLELAGADFTILGPRERDCGSILFRLGAFDLARRFALYARDTVKDYNFDSIVTSCAGCFRTFKRDYPEKLDIDLGVPIYHSSELFAEYINQGKLAPKHKINLPVTYHDPCHLGKHVGVYEAPRECIKAIGCSLEEMLNGRIKENSMCCGAGGGVRSGYREVAREVASYRISTDLPKDVKVMIQTCPFCYFNFQDAVETKGYSIENIDLTELLLIATRGPEASKVLGQERYNNIMSLSTR